MAQGGELIIGLVGSYREPLTKFMRSLTLAYEDGKSTNCQEYILEFVDDFNPGQCEEKSR